MNVSIHRVGMAVTALATLAAPAYAHPFHGFTVNGPLHALLHALDAAGYLMVALGLVVVTVATVKMSLIQRNGPRA